MNLSTQFITCVLLIECSLSAFYVQRSTWKLDFLDRLKNVLNSKNDVNHLLVTKIFASYRWWWNHLIDIDLFNFNDLTLRVGIKTLRLRHRFWLPFNIFWIFVAARSLLKQSFLLSWTPHNLILLPEKREMSGLLYMWILNVVHRKTWKLCN